MVAAPMAPLAAGASTGDPAAAGLCRGFEWGAFGAKNAGAIPTCCIEAPIRQFLSDIT